MIKGLWQLPIRKNPKTNKRNIKSNAKYHYFEYEESSALSLPASANSLCGVHVQKIHEYDENAESGQIVQCPHIACVTCYQKWKKLYLIEICSL